MPNIEDDVRFLLTLTRIKGMGPVRVRSILERFADADALFGASPASLEGIEGIGPKTARSILNDRPRAAREADRELDRAAELGVEIVPECDPRYPPLLRSLPDRPLLLSVFGALDAEGADRFTVGVVGSRRCSAYGLEQAERFGASLARAGLCIVSGGARGIDTAAHRGALAAGGRTIAVLGCGLSHVYPPENRAMYERIADSGGAVVSEFPIETPPTPENFPVRNRIISGMSLGVLVVEAGLRSGALITARQAVEEHGRDVFALPGRVDSDACAGSLDLIKRGGAALVTEPMDILKDLESAARHLHDGTHAARFGDGVDPAASPARREPSLPANASQTARLIVEACASPATVDEIIRQTGLAPAEVSRELTMLELSGGLARQGTRFVHR